MAEKSLDFENYRKYSTDPNPTTNPELQEFMSNQNKMKNQKFLQIKFLQKKNCTSLPTHLEMT